MAILRVIVGWNHFPIALGEEPIWVASRTPWVYGWVWLCWGCDCFEFSVWWIYRAKWESSEKNCCFSLEGESVEPCAVTWLECSKTLESSSLKWQSPFRTMHFTMRMSWKNAMVGTIRVGQTVSVFANTRAMWKSLGGECFACESTRGWNHVKTSRDLSVWSQLSIVVHAPSSDYYCTLVVRQQAFASYEVKWCASV